MTRLTWAQFRAVFPGHKLVQSKFNCSRDILLHLFRVCHFHGVLVNKQVLRNTHMNSQRAFVEKSENQIIWCLSMYQATSPFALCCCSGLLGHRANLQRTNKDGAMTSVCCVAFCDPCSRDCILGGFSRKTDWQGCHHCCHSPLSAAGSAS